MSVVKIDPKVAVNRRLHHTSQFKTNAIVARRGQDFLLDVHLSTTFDASLHTISLELRTGNRPNTFDRTLIRIPMVEYLDKRKWGMRTVGKSESVLQLKINIPARCLVASYELRVLGKSRKVLYTHKKPMYVLFNPWSPGMDYFIYSWLSLNRIVRWITKFVFFYSFNLFRSFVWRFEILTFSF